MWYNSHWYDAILAVDVRCFFNFFLFLSLSSAAIHLTTQDVCPVNESFPATEEIALQGRKQLKLQYVWLWWQRFFFLLHWMTVSLRLLPNAHNEGKIRETSGPARIAQLTSCSHTPQRVCSQWVTQKPTFKESFPDIYTLPWWCRAIVLNVLVELIGAGKASDLCTKDWWRDVGESLHSKSLCL